MQRRSSASRTERGSGLERLLAAVFLFAASIALTTVPLTAATQLKPAVDHNWQVAAGSGPPSAIAARCPDCAPDLTLTCPVPGRGLLELTMAAASVSNGLDGTTKQIRLTVANQVEGRRALTRATKRGFTPVLELPVDDELLDRMMTGGALTMHFYGQRSVVGLHDARDAISAIRRACQPAAIHRAYRFCTWSIVIACSPDRSTAGNWAGQVPDAIVRLIDGSYCTTIATDELANAKSRATALGGHVERSCLP
ncbi:MAG: hypothetical protein KKB37_03135 [Alphaproteobacteria bacterium]|nr:hypothetical protein [Alphaproteobacteria bacterium]